jgi:AmiR/NasT family two-component response regulator
VHRARDVRQAAGPESAAILSAGPPAVGCCSARPTNLNVRSDPTDTRHLKLLLADEDEGALRVTAALLRDLGHEVAEMAIGAQEAAEVIARDDPELSIVVVYKSDGYALELIEEIAAFARGPVIAILEKEDAAFVAAAAERGISAYSRLGDAESIQSAIEVAIRRHAEKRELVEQVQRLETALERRALIERAKGILMERHGVDERRAFDRLRDHARSRNRTVVDVAASVVEGHALLPAVGDPDPAGRDQSAREREPRSSPADPGRPARSTAVRRD